ncbi:MAG: bleomycin resistance protein [Altererythrobacter sp.]|nr:bleomycin resistance protein [Altererythrobacter sp.]
MTDSATPNLPARDFAASEAFYHALGFSTSDKGDGWMILERGDATLEFFPFPDLDPLGSSFGCCLRLDDLDAMMNAVRAAGIAEAEQGHPRFHAPRREASGLTIAYLLDPDGTLLRLIQNED